MVDVNTTAEKIAVMQHFSDGGKIISYELIYGWKDDLKPSWDWSMYKYKIKPQTVEEAAQEYNENHKVMVYSEHNSMSAFFAGAEWQKEHHLAPFDYRKKEFTIEVDYCNGTKLKVLKIRADLFGDDTTFKIILDEEQEHD